MGLTGLKKFLCVGTRSRNPATVKLEKVYAGSPGQAAKLTDQGPASLRNEPPVPVSADLPVASTPWAHSPLMLPQRMEAAQI